MGAVKGRDRAEGRKVEGVGGGEGGSNITTNERRVKPWQGVPDSGPQYKHY